MSAQQQPRLQGVLPLLQKGQQRITVEERDVTPAKTCYHSSDQAIISLFCVTDDSFPFQQSVTPSGCVSVHTSTLLCFFFNSRLIEITSAEISIQAFNKRSNLK